MKINSIIGRHIFREFIPPFVITTVFFSFVFLLAKILEITNLIVNYRIGMFTVVKVIVYTMPYFLVYVLPMSVMITVLLVFMRMSGDNEIDALKAGGVSLYGLMPPVILFCVFGFLLTAFMSIYGLPWGRFSLKEEIVKAATSHLNIGLKERTFNDSFQDVMLYVNEIDLKKDELRDVFIEDSRNENIMITVLAPRGRLSVDQKNATFNMKLYNGTINQVDLEKRTVNNLSFKTYDIDLDIRRAFNRGHQKDEKEMYLKELIQFLDDTPTTDERYWEALIEYHKKLAVPFACISLGILAVPLGVRSRSARRSFGFGLGLAAFMVYYILHAAGLVFGEAGKYPPVIGMWAPNILMGSIGVHFLARASKDRPVGVVFLFESMNRWKSKFLHTVSKEDYSVSNEQ